MSALKFPIFKNSNHMGVYGPREVSHFFSPNFLSKAVRIMSGDLFLTRVMTIFINVYILEIIARSLARSIARSIARSLARSLARSIARSLDRSIARSLARWLARSLARGPMRIFSGLAQPGFF